MIVVSAPRFAAAADRPTTATDGSMLVRAVDEAGEPLAGASIQVSIWTEDKDFKRNRFYTADDAGQAQIELPATLEIVRVWARSKGYAPMFAQLWPQAPRATLPGDFTFELKRGTTMGGIVRDEQGRPIRGARVEVRYESGGDGDNAHPPARYDDWLASGITTKTTDSEGRWQLDNAPPGDDVKVSVKLSHRDYINDTRWGSLQHEQGVTSAQLRDGSATIVMHRGITVSGKVVDPDGHPVKDAVLIYGDRPYWDEGRQEVHTDQDGVYRFEPLPPGETRFTVIAAGRMPEMRKVDVRPDMPSLDFPLRPGKLLHIKFVDGDGNAIPQVTVIPGQWRGAESLHLSSSAKQIPRLADKDGVFRWNGAPDDAVTFVFRAEGFANTEATFTADDRQHVQTMPKVLQIAGTVSDAATGKPLSRFRVVPVIHFTPDFPFLDRQHAQDGRDGKFNVEFERTDIEHGVQIEAPGHVTFRTSRRHPVGEADPKLDVRLQPTEPCVGTVVDAEGRGVEGAAVYVATRFQHLALRNLEDRDGSFSSNYAVRTDADGRFEIVPQIDRYALVVVAPDGYAEAERAPAERPGELRVRPWAQVSGRVVQDGKPMAGQAVYVEPIRLSGGDEPRVDARYHAQTGPDGSFVFPRVAPVACRVRPSLHFSVDSPLKSSRSMPLDLEPAQHVSLELGSGGAEVTGRLVLDEPREDFDFHFSLSYLVAMRPGVEPPRPLAEKGFEWQAGWTDAWRNSHEGGAYLLTLHNWFVKPEADGKFRISGVEPGDYQFAIALYGTTEGCLVHPVAQRVFPITVKAGQSIVELGDITVPTQPVPQVGDPAPDFAFTSPDGSRSDLAAQRGKYVLVDFWATWCRPCVAGLPEVEAVRKEFESTGRLIVVGANLDARRDDARKFLDKRPLRWHHVLLGDWSGTDVPRRYGVTSVPAYVLVDPEGKIAALEYSIDKLAPKLKDALSD